MDMIKDMLKLDVKNFNAFTALSLLSLIVGVLFYLYWGARFGVWYDIGIYSFTIVLVLPGIIGIILSLMEKSEE
jgi:hypothetical protein